VDFRCSAHWWLAQQLLIVMVSMQEDRDDIHFPLMLEPTVVNVICELAQFSFLINGDVRPDCANGIDVEYSVVSVYNKQRYSEWASG